MRPPRIRAAAPSQRPKRLPPTQNVAPDIVIGVAAWRGERNDCRALANGVSLTASVNSARRPCRPSHRGSRPREKSVNAGAPRGHALLAETFRALGILGLGDYDSKRGIRPSVEPLASPSGRRANDHRASFPAFRFRIFSWLAEPWSKP